MLKHPNQHKKQDLGLDDLQGREPDHEGEQREHRVHKNSRHDVAADRKDCARLEKGPEGQDEGRQ